jgi:ATP-dependent DNA helicase RecQ
MITTTDSTREALLKYFGFDEFREGQAEVIEAVLAGKTVVVVMPTGGGKSLCYQLPALMLDRVALVVSPLIALMKDQVDALSARGIPATFINSSLTYSEISERIAAIRRGRFKLVYIAPERFRSQGFTKAIAEADVRLFAIDEAHCISLWGHDFRPDYLRLKEAVDTLGKPQIIALTAAATPQVRDDIIKQLGLANPHVFVAGFDRPNLALRVLCLKSEKEKLATLKRVILKSNGPGIIYAATRKGVERITATLRMAGLAVEAYHGGMEEGERTRAQESFMRGSTRAIVATNAFGMGIDKSDIRFVVHFHLPGSIEAYYQEIGRAGRDGLPANCLLFFNYADTYTQQFFIEGSHPPPELISRVYDFIRSCGCEEVEISAREIASLLGIKNDMSVQSALVALERAGHIELGRSNDATVLAHLKVPIDVALDRMSDDSNEASLLRDLIFIRNVNDRQATEVNINEVAAWLGISEALARRALSSLAAQGIITYRNAHRGRGIRLLDQTPAAELGIDAEELAARATAEKQKLRKMIEFCYSKGCLWRFILNYFDDIKKVTRCGNCSNCAPRVQWQDEGETEAGTLIIGTPGVSHSSSSPKNVSPTVRTRRHRVRTPSNYASTSLWQRRRALNREEVIVVKKILSCVARLGGQFGKGTVMAVLRGVKTRQVAEHKLDRLSTYGMLEAMQQKQIDAFIKALIDAGCIAVRQETYPTVRLTDFGREVMLGRAEVLLELPA